MNPNKRVYIVLFVLPDIRGPPQAFSHSNKNKEDAYVYKRKNFFQKCGQIGQVKL